MDSKFGKKVGAGIIIVLSSIILAVCAFGDNDPERGRRGQHGPPPEAYTACEGKNAGDTAEFVSPHGDTVTGTCEQEGDKMVLRPDNPPPRRERNNNGE